MVTLRPYQEDALDIILGAIPSDKHILIQMATAAGKTILFSELIRHLLEKWPHIKIGILAHRRELITQARDKLLTVWPEAPIGIACSSVKNKIDTEQAVVIGSVQTLARRIETTSPFDLIIIDESHRLPPINQESQYSMFLSAMKRYNPEVRVLGVTATPFRLGHGYCYGTVCKPENENLFEKLHYRIGIKDLQKQGFLCGYRAKEAENISTDLKQVKINGDYNINDLSEVMSREHHVGSAVKAYQTYGKDRKHVVAFCVTIEHAEKLKKAFLKAGIPAACVHSKMAILQRDVTLKMFEDCRIRVLCNVGVLTEGWDSPAVDCIIMCRPTKSAALYVQMTGRGLRLHPDKEDVLILDLANNCKEHGDPDSPKVIVPGRSRSNDPILKSCPECLELVGAATKVCPSCGFEWPVEIVHQNGDVKMKDVSWAAQASPTLLASVKDVNICDYVSAKGNRMVKVSLTCKSDKSFFPYTVNEFFLFEPGSHDFARRKAFKTWENLVGTEAPKSVDEAMDRIGELHMSIPGQVEIIEKGKWWNVYNWKVNESDIKLEQEVNGNKDILTCKRCGEVNSVINAVSKGPHAYEAICPNCSKHIQWVSKNNISPNTMEVAT